MHALPTSVTFSVVLLLSSLAGCMSWDELPADATGFLVVDQATLSGAVDGHQVVPASTRASGYCISGGWRLEMRANTEAGASVTHVLEVLDLDMREREATVQFVRQGPALLVRDAREAGQLKLWTCVGDEADPDFEQEATDVTLDMATNHRGDIEVAYTAMFENGDELQGQFDMEMPVVD
jgi:hypothetical protein